MVYSTFIKKVHLLMFRKINRIGFIFCEGQHEWEIPFYLNVLAVNSSKMLSQFIMCRGYSCAPDDIFDLKSLRVNFYTWSITETKYHNPRKGSQKYRVKYQTHLLTNKLILAEFNVLCYRKDTKTCTGIRSPNMFYFYIYTDFVTQIIDRNILSISYNLMINVHEIKSCIPDFCKG